MKITTCICNKYHKLELLNLYLHSLFSAFNVDTTLQAVENEVI